MCLKGKLRSSPADPRSSASAFSPAARAQEGIFISGLQCAHALCTTENEWLLLHWLHPSTPGAHSWVTCCRGHLHAWAPATHTMGSCHLHFGALVTALVGSWLCSNTRADWTGPHCPPVALTLFLSSLYPGDTRLLLLPALCHRVLSW